jgi:hypothetical protein
MLPSVATDLAVTDQFGGRGRLPEVTATAPPLMHPI